MTRQKNLRLCLPLLIFVFCCETVFAAQRVPESQPLSTDAKDPAFDKLLSPKPTLEILSRGLHWAEGLGWDKKSECVFFTDVGRGALFRWKENSGVSQMRFSTASRKAGQNYFHGDGLLVDKTGHILIAGHIARQIFRIENNLSFTTLADKFDGKRLSSPNDLTMDSAGNLFFTDPPYGLPGKNESHDKELGFNGVYRVSSSGELALLTRDLTWPNGIALSPDEKTLYVSVSDEQKPVVMAYALKANGTTGKGRIFFNAAPFAKAKQGLPNGLKADKDGNIFLAGPGGIFVLSPQGKLLGRIFIADYTTNCAWGDGGSTLYVTTAHTLCRFKTNSKGAGF